MDWHHICDLKRGTDILGFLLVFWGFPLGVARASASVWFGFPAGGALRCRRPSHDVFPSAGWGSEIHSIMRACRRRMPTRRADKRRILSLVRGDRFSVATWTLPASLAASGRSTIWSNHAS